MILSNLTLSILALFPHQKYVAQTIPFFRMSLLPYPHPHLHTARLVLDHNITNNKTTVSICSNNGVFLSATFPSTVPLPHPHLHTARFVLDQHRAVVVGVWIGRHEDDVHHEVALLQKKWSLVIAMWTGTCIGQGWTFRLSERCCNRNHRNKM